MPIKLPALHWLQAFDASARHLSFTLAAEELCLTSSAISQKIKLLEDYLGVPLFERSIRSLTLTREGEMYFTIVSRVLDYYIARHSEFKKWCQSSYPFTGVSS